MPPSAPHNSEVDDDAAGKRAVSQAMQDATAEASSSKNLRSPLDRRVLVTSSSKRQQSVNSAAGRRGAKNTATSASSARSSSALSPMSGRHHKAVLDIPLQYVIGGGGDSGGSSHGGGLSLQQKSRLSVYSTFPIAHSARSATTAADNSRHEAACQLSASSGLRGRTGYTAGSLELRWSHHHHQAPPKSSAAAASRCTTLNASVGIQPKIGSNMGRDSTEGSICSSSSPAAIPAFRLGICTTHRETQTKHSSSLSANANFPKSTGEPCLLSLSATSQRTLLLNNSNNNINQRRWRPLDLWTQCSTTLDPTSPQLMMRSIHSTVALSPSSSNGRLASNTSGKKETPNWTVQLGYSRQRDKVFRPLVGLSVSLWLPKMKSLYNQRKLLDLSVQWKGSQSWQLGGLWTQKAAVSDGVTSIRQPHRQIGVGVTLMNNNSSVTGKSAGTGAAKQSLGGLGILSWVFTWNEGDFTLRVPILLVTSASATAIYYHQAFQFFYLSVLSSIIQDVVGHAFLPAAAAADEIGRDDQEQQHLSNRSLRHQKAKEEALLQQSFMERQAKIRMAAEKERNGLVIHRAVYFLHRVDSDGKGLLADDLQRENGDSENSLDVTIPLQFWVSSSESKLELHGALKRSSMLGFYDIAATAPPSLMEPSKPSSASGALAAGSKEVRTHWTDKLMLFWLDNESIDDASQAHQPAVPQLAIQYDYGGRSYEITVGDDEKITLPSARAKLLLDP